jgi:hypothetical protein
MAVLDVVLLQTYGGIGCSIGCFAGRSQVIEINYNSFTFPFVKLGQILWQKANHCVNHTVSFPTPLKTTLKRTHSKQHFQRLKDHPFLAGINHISHRNRNVEDLMTTQTLQDFQQDLHLSSRQEQLHWSLREAQDVVSSLKM